MSRSSSRAKTKYGWLLLLLLACAIAIAFFFQNKKATVTRYETISIEKGNIEAIVAAIGTLSPRLSVEVGAQVSGQIVTLSVEPGHQVEKDQLLVEIDARLQQATVDAGRAELAAQKAQLASRQAEATLAKQQYNRQQKLVKQGATREKDLQTAVAEWKIAEANIDELNARIEQTASRLKGDEAQLGYTRIYAPMAGTVLSVDAKRGQTLNATYSTPSVLSIADLSQMTIEAKVAEADIGYIRAGMPVWFTTLGNNIRRWHGTVRQVLPAPVINESNKSIVHYRVLFDVVNDDGALMSGMTVQVSFVTEYAEDVLLVPLQAINAVDQESHASGLYRIRIMGPNKQPQWREIKIGRQDSWSAEVLEGLTAGEEIIIREMGPMSTES